jgi:signal recognition particle GTPase
MVDIISFNDLDETQTIEQIISLVKQYNPIKIQVETNSIGTIFYGLLQKALQKLPYNKLTDKPQTQLIGFNMNNESKNKLVNKFQVAIQNKEVTILDNEELLKQMTNFVSKLTNNNKVTYSARNNLHDDYVVSMMLGYDCLTKGGYSVL